MVKSEAKNWIVVGDLMISFYQAGPIGDEVWEDYCDTLSSPPCAKVLATSIGAVEVSAPQRRSVSAALKRTGVTVAVVTDEPIVRGLMTAVSWLGRVDVKAFPWHKIGDAFRHLSPEGVSEKQALDLVDQLRRRVEDRRAGEA
ncbi:MAG: hypothetical protein HC927_14200 [Deltaproteobacteria bacterium]|nr:hypothetical protein [Deltaproteobacteria bacterium]